MAVHGLGLGIRAALYGSNGAARRSGSTFYRRMGGEPRGRGRRHRTAVASPGSYGAAGNKQPGCISIGSAAVAGPSGAGQGGHVVRVGEWACSSP